MKRSQPTMDEILEAQIQVLAQNTLREVRSSDKIGHRFQGSIEIRRRD